MRFLFVPLFALIATFSATSRVCAAGPFDSGGAPIKLDDASWQSDGYTGDPEEIASFANHIAAFLEWCLKNDGVAQWMYEDPLYGPDLAEYEAGTISALTLVERWDGKLFSHYLSQHIRGFAISYYPPSPLDGGRDFYLDYTETVGEENFLAPLTPEAKAKVFAVIDERFAVFNTSRESP